jgi:hypothetical protein
MKLIAIESYSNFCRRTIIVKVIQNIEHNGDIGLLKMLEDF